MFSLGLHAANLRRVLRNHDMICQTVEISEPFKVDAGFSGYFELEFDDNVDIEVLQVWNREYDKMQFCVQWTLSITFHLMKSINMIFFHRL